jgi:divalent metal cation (Fe/Co/Zn/Cd) transporter
MLRPPLWAGARPVIARDGRQLGYPVLQTESYVTLFDALLAAALVSLVLNALLGWWWAAPPLGSGDRLLRP